MSKVTIGLTKLRCIEQSSDTSSDSDEPYVLVFAAQLESVAGLVKVPLAGTTLYGPWGDVDDGEHRVPKVPHNFWGFDGKARELAALDDAFFMVALMENDDADAGGVRAALHAQLLATLASHANADMSRADLAKELKKTMRHVLTGLTVTGIPSDDDLLDISELRFDGGTLQKVKNGPVVEQLVLGAGGSGGRYRLDFVMKHA